MSVHAWLLRLPAVLSESNGDLDAGATVTAAGPLAETLIVRLDASHDYQPRRLDLPPGGGHRGYAAIVDGGGLMMACCCSHSMGGR
jgi:hypothetical protein